MRAEFVTPKWFLSNVTFPFYVFVAKCLTLIVSRLTFSKRLFFLLNSQSLIGLGTVVEHNNNANNKQECQRNVVEVHVKFFFSLVAIHTVAGVLYKAKYAGNGAGNRKAYQHI